MAGQVGRKGTGAYAGQVWDGKRWVPSGPRDMVVTAQAPPLGRITWLLWGGLAVGAVGLLDAFTFRSGIAGFLILVAIGLLIAFWVMRDNARNRAIRGAIADAEQSKAQFLARPPTEILIEDDGNYDWSEVVGESHKVEQIERLLKRSDDEDGKQAGRVYFPQQATLAPEPSNRHDPDAIKVMIDGVAVGYVPADLTEDFRDAVKAVAAKRGLAIQLDHWQVRTSGKIGWGRAGIYGVVLDLPDDFGL